MCLDWILASTEYTEFVYMMLDFKGAQDWDGEDYQYDAGGAYNEGDEEDEEDEEEDIGGDGGGTGGQH
jgi:hypothetical protein